MFDIDKLSHTKTVPNNAYFGIRQKINPLDILKIYNIDPFWIVFDPTIKDSNCHFRKWSSKVWHDGTQLFDIETCFQCFNKLLHQTDEVAYYTEIPVDWDRLSYIKYNCGYIKLASVYNWDGPKPENIPNWMSIHQRAHMPVICEYIYKP